MTVARVRVMRNWEAMTAERSPLVGKRDYCQLVWVLVKLFLFILVIALSLAFIAQDPLAFWCHFDGLFLSTLIKLSSLANFFLSLKKET